MRHTQHHRHAVNPRDHERWPYMGTMVVAAGVVGSALLGWLTGTYDDAEPNAWHDDGRLNSQQVDEATTRANLIIHYPVAHAAEVITTELLAPELASE